MAGLNMMAVCLGVVICNVVMELVSGEPASMLR